jgi:hypothetical protein
MLLVALLVGCGETVPEAELPSPNQAVAEAPAAAPSPDAEWKFFGAPFTISEAVPASAVFSDPAPSAGKVVRVKGELTEVCQKMGCWAVVRDDAGHSVRITMKDHAFGIDKDTAGRACDVEGELVQKAVDPERVKHFESEGSTNPPEAGKAEAWELVATSIAVSRA